jgi:hypothetical protein
MFVLQVNSDGVQPVMKGSVKLLDILSKIIGKVGQAAERFEVSIGHM